MTRRIQRKTTLGVILIAAGLSFACTTVGTGKQVLLKAQCDRQGPDAGICSYLLDRLPAYVSTSRADAILIPAKLRGDAEAPPSRGHLSLPSFRSYLGQTYGSNPHIIDLGFTVKDRTKTPPYSPYDYRSALLTLLTGTKAPSPAEYEEKVRQLGLLPDLVRSTAHHHTDAQGHRVYHYYPRLALDFTAALRGLVPPDRLGSLFFLVRIKNCKSPDGVGSGGVDHVRFLDFSPKAADIAEFTRGELQDSLTAQLSAQAALAGGSQAQEVADGTTTTETASDTETQGLSLSWSESLTRSLVDALERRSAGIIDGGHTFVATLRGLRDVKLAGTYSYDLLLEVPSTVEAYPAVGYAASVPVVTEIRADVMLVAVVRHVMKRGRTGLLTRAPENENDDTIDQVVLATFPDQVIWRHSGEDWLDRIVTRKPACALKVVTNREDALYEIEQSGEVIAVGRGLSGEFAIPPDSPGATVCTATVRFHDILVVEKGVKTVLSAPETKPALSTTAGRIVVATYE